MSRFGRRTFLASSAGVAAGAAAGGSWPSGALAESGAAERPIGSADAAVRPQGALRAGGLTVNGRRDPVGIDPDDCSFAWTLQASGRAVAQTGWRIVVERTDPAHAGVVWDSEPVTSARQAFVAYAGPTLAADGAYRWTVEARGWEGRWGPASAPARFTTSLRDNDWQAQWLRPAGDSQQPDRVTYLRTEVTPPAGAVDRVTAYVSAAHTYRLYVNGAPVDAWPSFSYPDEQYVRAVDLTGTVTGGRRSAVGVLHRWYGPGQGRPASSPGLLLQLSVWYRDGRRVVFGSDGTWRERPAEWLPSPQRNSDVGDFVEWVDGREQPQGWSSPGYDDGAWSPVTVVGPAGTAPFTRTYAQRTTITETPVHPVRLHTVAGGAVVADFGAVYAARPTRARSAGGSPGAPSPCEPVTSSIPTARSRRCTGRRRRTCRPPTSCGRATRPSRPSPTSASATCRSTNRANRWAPTRSWLSPGTPPCPRSPVRRSRPTTARSMRSGASTHARACIAATSNSSTRRPGRRASSSGTPPTSPKGSCGPTATRT